MTTTNKPKYRPRVGDERWLVSWTYEFAWVDGDDTSEDREVDRDNCKERTRIVETREDAEKMAREVWPQTDGLYGVVEFWKAIFVPYDACHAVSHPHVGYWYATSDGAYYEGDD